MSKLKNKYNYGFDVLKGEEGLTVSLPHQCDEWIIVGDFGEKISNNDALEQMDEFIEQAIEARRKLLKMFKEEKNEKLRRI